MGTTESVAAANMLGAGRLLPQALALPPALRRGLHRRLRWQAPAVRSLQSARVRGRLLPEAVPHSAAGQLRALVHRRPAGEWPELRRPPLPFRDQVRARGPCPCTGSRSRAEGDERTGSGQGWGQWRRGQSSAVALGGYKFIAVEGDRYPSGNLLLVGCVKPPAVEDGGIALSSPLLARRALHITNANNATKAMRATAAYLSRSTVSPS